MINRENLGSLIGADVVDPTGSKVGSVGQVYVDDHDGRPSWVSVRTGLFGMKESLVPLDRADWDGDDLRVAYEKDRVKDAPRVDADAHLEPSDEDELYRYYGMEGTGEVGAVHDRNTSSSDAAMARDDSMSRTAEQPDAGSGSMRSGRVRLRRYVVTEEQSVSVPVQREEVRVERDPVVDDNVDADPDIAGGNDRSM
ncbi:PRC and DUF2382 domain-containing protein [Ruicaihuangia caeni]|uniref:PRC and DUF2382 domain-containing protein n=1 Tax=Ruicaihuangia caeni TaxID=3042517 RepID=A0AAW6T854_9MICO|nr:PRC and DUF2382 domain-containing protein [Klugiella sp. YN-L-19]MDI2099286.1 PRC and DUF2382 domain-containing protein [Klugiella sp. YN-L-19]